MQCAAGDEESPTGYTKTVDIFEATIPTSTAATPTTSPLATTATPTSTAAPSTTAAASSTAPPQISTTAAAPVSSSAPPTTSPLATTATPTSTAAPSTTAAASSTAPPQIFTTAAAPVSSVSFTNTSTSLPNATFSPLYTSSSSLVPLLAVPDDHIPNWIFVGAAITAGHLPRALELVQFLSIYCTSLSSQQQNQVSRFQVASFTHIAMSQSNLCSVCPGACNQPLVLVVPTFVLVVCLFAVGTSVAVFDMCKALNLGRSGSNVKDSLLDSTNVSGAAAVQRRASLRQSLAVVCNRGLRGLIETCSSYIIMPCTFVFVMNVRPASFAQAEPSHRFMIVMLPVVTLLFRALVIRQRVVELTCADQKQLFAGSFCSCLIAVVLSVYFEQVEEVDQLKEVTPQYIVVVLLVVQVLAQTIIRRTAAERSIYDSVNWHRSLAPWQASSAKFPFEELETRLVMSSIKNASSSGAVAAAKFLLLNYLAISQIIMVVVGISSSRSMSRSNVQNSSAVIGSIPLVTAASLLLYNTIKIAFLLWQKCFGMKQKEPRLSEMDCQY